MSESDPTPEELVLQLNDGISCVDAMEQWAVSTVHPLPNSKDREMVESALKSAFLVKSTCLAELEKYEEALSTFDRSGVGLNDIVENPQETISTLNILTARAKLLCLLGRAKEAEEFYEAVQQRVLSFGLPPVEILTTMATMGVMINLTTRVDGSPDLS